MQIWNTYSRKKEVLRPIRRAHGKQAQGKPLRLFVCGPTVFDYVHVGNMRTMSVFDTLVRWLRFSGTKVFYLQNITDVDDKIIRRANEEKRNWKEVARTYERAFREDEKRFNIRSVTKYARATAYIKEIVRQVQTLIKKGHAYEIPNDPSTGRAGGWYFDVTTFPDYGELAKRTASQAEDGVSRIDESVNKRNRADFCLWKFTDAKNAKRDANDAKEPSWDTPLGKGRPGWHIEDTAITEKFFGPQYDVHGAGIDLMFPHHEAEIAQQESASGKKPFVKIWMHVAFFDLKGAKMSKSLGNVITAREFLKSHSGDTFRFIVASHHFRTRIEYDEALAVQAEQALAGVTEFLAKLKLVSASRHSRARGNLVPHRKIPAGARPRAASGAGMTAANKRFREAMDDDLNTPKALAALFDLIAAANKQIWSISKADARAIETLLCERFGVLGIMLPPLKIPANIRQLARKRELFRHHEQFAQADALRREIETLGWKVEDTAAGALVIPKSLNPKP